MEHKDLHKKQWKDRKIERMWVTVGFGKAHLHLTTKDGFCYTANLKETDIKMARLEKKEKS